MPLTGIDRDDTLNTLLNLIEDGESTIDGEIDLAVATRMFPNTLLVRDDTTVELGKLICQVKTETTESGTLLSGLLNTTEIRATQQDATLHWKHPMRTKFAIRNSADGVVVERLVCQSTFASATVKGRLFDGQFVGQVDLPRLQRELEKFIDLAGLEMEGRIRGRAKWQLDDNQYLAAHGSFAANDFRLAMPGREDWVEKEFNVNAMANFKMDGSHVASAQVTVVSGMDRLDGVLREPADLTNDTGLPIFVRLRGQLQKWQRRLEPLFSIAPIRLSGEADTQAELTVTSDRIAFANLENARA